jgi:hypothetical protein
MTPTLLATTLVRADHIRSFHVHPIPAGWEAFKREDHRVVHQQRYTDWHRVERTLTRFRREIAALIEQGWRETLNGL